MCMKVNSKMKWDLLKGTEGIISLSTGNTKLVSNPNETMFIIWNMPAEKTCPFATEHCKAACYAKKAERLYPECLPARVKNMDFSKSGHFVAFMVKALHYIASLKNYKNAPHITVRIHESGDFYSVEYLEKWLDIANLCRDIKNMDFAAYTKSLPYLIQACKDGYSIKDCNIHFLSSIWDDTKPARIDETKYLNLPIYTAFEKGYFDESYTKCECSDCGHCRQCFKGESAKKRIAVTIH